jgi:hypothetical protein
MFYIDFMLLPLPLLFPSPKIVFDFGGGREGVLLLP